MQQMKFFAFIGKSRIATGRGYMRALRAILENGQRLVEVGFARIEREDGAVVARIDLDVPVPDGRSLKEVFAAGWAARDGHMDGYATAELDQSWIDREWADYQKKST